MELSLAYRNAMTRAVKIKKMAAPKQRGPGRSQDSNYQVALAAARQVPTIDHDAVAAAEKVYDEGGDDYTAFIAARDVFDQKVADGVGSACNEINARTV